MGSSRHGGIGDADINAFRKTNKRVVVADAGWYRGMRCVVVKTWASHVEMPTHSRAHDLAGMM